MLPAKPGFYVCAGDARLGHVMPASHGHCCEQSVFTLAVRMSVSAVSCSSAPILVLGSPFWLMEYVSANGGYPLFASSDIAMNQR